MIYGRAFFVTYQPFIMTNTQLSREELRRYSRHILIPDFNIEGQKKLKAARVLVVGCGGLGAPLLSYLTAAGVGTIGLVDHDTVDESNLHRQILFTLDDVGKPKVEAAARRLSAQNPHLALRTYQEKLKPENILDIVKDYDVVADGTDNFPTRYLVNDACVILNKVNVYASIYRFEGQVSVFNYLQSDNERGPNYRDLYPTPPPPGQVPSCAEGGVLGVLPGIIGSLQANEVIKVITGVGKPLAGVLFIFDTLSFESRKLKFRKNRDNPLQDKTEIDLQQTNYEAFCGCQFEQKESVAGISVQEFRAMRHRQDDYLLLDVREPYEYEIANLGGKLVPLREVENNWQIIPMDKPVIVHCRSGQRSQQAIRILERKGFDNLLNLQGGILAWTEEIDAQPPRY